MSMRFALLLVLLLGQVVNCSAQYSSVKADTSRFDFKPLVIPSALIGYGLVGLQSDKIKSWNRSINRRVVGKTNFGLDDYLQYMPYASVYGLNAIGIKGKHNFKDRTTVLGTAYLIMGITVTSTKLISKIERPNGLSTLSFPSGHTATAFMGAEFLRKEYQHKSPWYGVGGYVAAASVGYLRQYNNKHWMTDVLAGAGVGILSTKLGYWLHPFMKRVLFPKGRVKGAAVVPFYNGGYFGVNFLVVD